jgi:hypothetical protein
MQEAWRPLVHTRGPSVSVIASQSASLGRRIRPPLGYQTTAGLLLSDLDSWVLSNGTGQRWARKSEEPQVTRISAQLEALAGCFLCTELSLGEGFTLAIL